jgi:ABC-type transport system involved in multi-copper enzyme maturation permease subunit
MTLLVRVELLKMRTVRVTYGLVLTVAALTGLFAVIESSVAGKTSGTYAVASLTTAAGQATVTTLTSWSMILAAVLGLIVASGEFRHASATLTYLATPDRKRVLLAKLLAASFVGAIFGLVAAAVSTGLGLAFIAGHGDLIKLAAAAMFGHAAGAMLGAALMAMVGVGLGFLIRSQLVGIITIFIWALVIESVIGGLFTSVRPFLPYTASTALAGIKLGGAAFGPAHSIKGGSALPFATTAILLVGVAALISVVATCTTMRRDVA